MPRLLSLGEFKWRIPPEHNSQQDDLSQVVTACCGQAIRPLYSHNGLAICQRTQTQSNFRCWEHKDCFIQGSPFSEPPTIPVFTEMVRCGVRIAISTAPCRFQATFGLHELTAPRTGKTYWFRIFNRHSLTIDPTEQAAKLLLTLNQTKEAFSLFRAHRRPALCDRLDNVIYLGLGSRQRDLIQFEEGVRA
jgi:hypothetical protein